MKIGLLVDYIASEYNEKLIQGISSYCKERNIELLLFVIGQIHSNFQNYEYQYVSITAQIKKSNLDGIIINAGTQLHGMSESAFVSYLRSYKDLAIVNVAMEIPEIPSIIVDCNTAFDSMIQYLIDKQHCKRIALMGVDSNSQEVITRTEIYKNVLKRNGLEVPVIWKANFEYYSALRVLSEHRQDNKTFDFDAIVALNDDMAYACIDYYRDALGLKVPQDIIITGYDDLDRSSFCTPNLSSINQQIEYQGYMAAETLVKQLEGKKVSPVQTVMAKAILRQSTEKSVNAQYSYKNNDFVQVETAEEKLIKERYDIEKWYTKRNQLLKAATFYSNMQYDVTPENLNKLFVNELQSFGFSAVAIVVYEKSIEVDEPFEYFNMPSRAVLISGFDYKTGFNTNNLEDPVIFNPNEGMIPKGFFKFDYNGNVVISLFHRNIQYGYMILNYGTFDNGVYDLLQKAVSHQMALSFAYLKMLTEQSEIKDKYKKLDLIAHTDELTGLTNRRGFMELAETTMNFAETVGQTGLVIFCDMNGLKKINDTYGHDSGDIAIKAQGKILRSNFRANDIVARLGGDEFVVICPGLSTKTFAFIEKKIKKECEKWTEKEKSPFKLSICLGYASYPSKENGYKLQELLMEADDRLYKKKRRFKTAEKRKLEEENKSL